MAGQGRKPEVFYGPHACARGCGVTICKAAKDEGGKEYDYPEGIIYPNTRWKKHVCSKTEAAPAEASA